MFPYIVFTEKTISINAQDLSEFRPEWLYYTLFRDRLSLPEWYSKIENSLKGLYQM